MKNQINTLTQAHGNENAKPVKGQILNHLNQQQQKIATKQDELSIKFGSRINCTELFKPGHRKLDDKHIHKDKADRATVEQVLDPRTRMILFKLINQGVIYEVNGCISTGKEANVYHAMTPEKAHLAVKIYKTSILVFKDRDRYVSGEFRFRHGYSKSNPRKMVQTWAEKEMRNLKRLQQAGIPCPDAICLRLHVLVMTLVGGSSGWAAPRLKDATIDSEESYKDIYRQLVKILWKMYHKCKLIHADFSEYNLLYFFVITIDITKKLYM
jgi:RIO kinase 1